MNTYFHRVARQTPTRFWINNVTREGIPELLEYLNEDLPTLTLEEAEEKQRMGLNEWDPLPDGV